MPKTSRSARGPDDPGLFVGSLIAGPVFLWLIDRAIQFNWILGLGLTIFFSFWLAVLLSGWRRKAYTEYSRTFVGAFLLMTLMLAIVVFSSASMILFRLSPHSYTGTATIEMMMFMRYYVWLALEAVPGIRISDTFGWQRPLQHHGAIASGYLLLFRLVVLATLLKAVKEWLYPTTPNATAA
jgi:hypothetical protein